jgi:hypothetical protein
MYIIYVLPLAKPLLRDDGFLVVFFSGKHATKLKLYHKGCHDVDKVITELEDDTVELLNPVLCATWELQTANVER